MGFTATTTATITEGLTRSDAKGFITFLKLYWNGQPNEFTPTVAKALNHIGVVDFKLTANVAQGVVTKLERKSGLSL